MSREVEQIVPFDPDRHTTWFKHGQIEINATPFHKKTGKYDYLYFHTRSIKDGFESDITVGELAVILSLSSEKANTLSEISENFAKWTDGICEDFGISNKYVGLKRSNLNDYIETLEEKFGFGIIKKVNGPSWRLVE